MVAGFVLDASVTAAWCFADEATPATDALRESLMERSVVVPKLWHAESTNLLLVAVRRKRITLERCVELLEQFENLPIETADETHRMGGPILRLGHSQDLTVYDAIYLDLAMVRGLALATRDKALRRAAHAMQVALIDL